ncbi:hypothetical protein U3A59_03005 [Algoriphagus sp. E1-3-M2]|nr:hypothetical protein [Algoriphagus sp. E1-3-M2]
MISEILQRCIILSVGEFEIKSALQSDFKDFEDAIQFYIALTNPDIKGIITRNTSDYTHSTLPVYSTQEFLGFFK